MTVNRMQFIKEYRIAKEQNNVDFMEWLSELMWQADEVNLGGIVNE